MTDGASYRRRTARVAAAILAAGWIAAVVVWVRAGPPPPVDEDVAYEMDAMRHSRRAARDLERVGGKSALLAQELNERVAALWEGRARAYTVAVFTAAVAGGYALLRRFPAEDE